MHAKRLSDESLAEQEYFSDNVEKEFIERQALELQKAESVNSGEGLSDQAQSLNSDRSDEGESSSDYESDQELYANLYEGILN